MFFRSSYDVDLWVRPLDKTFWYAIRGDYGSFVSEWIRHLCGPAVFLDVGANQGLFSLLAAKNPHIIQVHAFEPQNKVVKTLRRNLSGNSALDVVVHPFAIGLAEGSGHISQNWRHSGAATLRHSSRKRGQLVQLVGHQYLDRHLPNKHPVFAKIDVEGSELNVLTALFSSNLGEKVQGLLVEENLAYQRRGEIERVLAARGFQLVAASDGHNQRDLLFEPR